MCVHLTQASPGSTVLRPSMGPSPSPTPGSKAVFWHALYVAVAVGSCVCALIGLTLCMVRGGWWSLGTGRQAVAGSSRQAGSLMYTLIP